MISIFGVSPIFPQEKQNEQKSLMESYIGKWRGNVTTTNINRAGGWTNGFAGYHQISKEVAKYYLDVRFIHPMDDPVAIDLLKNFGYTSEYIQSLRNLMGTPYELTIIGYGTFSGLKEDTHQTREYCEECYGTDGTTTNNFPEVIMSILGRIDLVKNKISFEFTDYPKEYDKLGSSWGEPKLVALNKIEFNYEEYGEFYGGEYDFEQFARGEIYRIYTKKDTLGKTVHINEPIITDKFTQRDIVVPNKGKVIIKPNSESKFKEDRLLEQILGEIISIIKPGVDYKVRTPQAVLAVRGTQFITEVAEDGTTTLAVLDGEVEFSDILRRKTVLVKKNQSSVVKPTELPTEPVSINPKMIPRWWE